jgi:transposase-like protein
MAGRRASGLSAPHPSRRCFDRRRLSCRVRRALAAAFSGSVGKDVVSRTWRKVNGDWDACNARSLVDEPVVRLILDGTVARVRLDKKATSVSLLVALGVRADGQKVLLTRALSLPRSSSIGTPYTAGQRS